MQIPGGDTFFILRGNIWNLFVVYALDVQWRLHVIKMGFIVSTPGLKIIKNARYLKSAIFIKLKCNMLKVKVHYGNCSENGGQNNRYI